MYWQNALPDKVIRIDRAAASLLDALELQRPMGEQTPQALGRWLAESADAGVIADDTVVWLHAALLLRNAAA